MQISVRRIRQGKHSTLSEIYIDGDFFCYGLEDSVREEKIKGSTAIPAGTYALALNRYGGMNAKYKRRFEQIHRGMIEIRDIPGFKFVYIHIGNHFGDTAGCLLVGDSYSRDDDGDYILHKSTKAYTRLYRMLVEAVSLGQAELMIK